MQNLICRILARICGQNFNKMCSLGVLRMRHCRTAGVRCGKNAKCTEFKLRKCGKFAKFKCENSQSAVNLVLNNVNLMNLCVKFSVRRGMGGANTARHEFNATKFSINAKVWGFSLKIQLKFSSKNEPRARRKGLQARIYGAQGGVQSAQGRITGGFVSLSLSLSLSLSRQLIAAYQHLGGF